MSSPGNPIAFFLPEGYRSFAYAPDSRVFTFLLGGTSNERWSAACLNVYYPQVGVEGGRELQVSVEGGRESQVSVEGGRELQVSVEGGRESQVNAETKRESQTCESLREAKDAAMETRFVPEGLILLSPFNNLPALRDRLLAFLHTSYDDFHHASAETQHSMLLNLLRKESSCPVFLPVSRES